jgi:hypothetical protein
MFGGGPLALGIDLLAWMRIRRTGRRYARAATAATAAFAGAVGLIVWIMSPSTVW